MDFQQLLAKMQQLDQPVGEAQVTECPPDMPPAPMAAQQPETPPSMSVNLNAQGLDNIESILKLIAKVNPDMQKPADAGLPSMGAMPNLTPPGPTISGLGNLDAGPLKMLPDLDSDEPGEPSSVEIEPIDKDGEEDGEEDNDNAKETRYSSDEYGGEHDEDPTGGDKPQNPFPFGDDESDDEKKDEWANSPDEEESDISASIRDGNDLNKKKASFSDKPYRGDNPMATEGTDLRSQIRAELLRRLNEAKQK